MKNLPNNEIINLIASLCSILGLIFSIFVMIITLRVNSKINNKLRKYSDVEFFNTHREENANKLIAYQTLIQEDNVLDFQLIANISTRINELNNLDSILTRKDKRHIKNIKKELAKDKSQMTNKTKQKICNHLSYFISRYNKEEILL